MDLPFRSTAPFRNNICFQESDLGSYGTQKLPDGATVYLSGTDSLYRLVKNMGSADDALVGLVINPNDGSSNRWVRVTQNGSNPWAAQVVLGANLSVSPSAQNAWTPLGSTPGSFLLAWGSNTAWTLNPTTGVLRYRGPTRLVSVSYQVTLIGGAAVDVEAALSVSGDVPAGDTAPVPQFGNQAGSVTTSVRDCLSGQRGAQIGTNDTFRLMLRNLTGTQQITALYAAISIN